MTYSIRPLIIVLAALSLAACMQDVPASADRNVRAPQATVVGEPVNCIETRQIDGTNVYDDYTIDFEMRDNTIYRNTLPNRCGGLGFGQRFGYDLRGTTRLCSTDIIRVLDSDGRMIGSCGLGQFVPVTVADAG
ncbi:MAG TPA: DUF6491 family protein [Paracoccaceae bacterium]|nr:DUF6491 family protein [Paracoccaceae bacterium]